VSTFTDQLATDAQAVFLAASELGQTCTIRRVSGAVDGSDDFTAVAVLQQFVGPADTKNEQNFVFAEADYPTPTEGDYITDPDDRRWTVTKATPDDLGGMTIVQAWAPVEAP